MVTLNHTQAQNVFSISPDVLACICVYNTLKFQEQKTKISEQITRTLCLKWH